MAAAVCREFGRRQSGAEYCCREGIPRRLRALRVWNPARSRSSTRAHRSRDVSALPVVFASHEEAGAPVFFRPEEQSVVQSSRCSLAQNRSSCRSVLIPSQVYAPFARYRSCTCDDGASGGRMCRDERAGRVPDLARHEAASPHQRDSSRSAHDTAVQMSSRVAAAHRSR
jgi:hypothetical protein